MGGGFPPPALAREENPVEACRVLLPAQKGAPQRLCVLLSSMRLPPAALLHGSLRSRQPALLLNSRGRLKKPPTAERASLPGLGEGAGPRAQCCRRWCERSAGRRSAWLPRGMRGMQAAEATIRGTGRGGRSGRRPPQPQRPCPWGAPAAPRATASGAESPTLRALRCGWSRAGGAGPALGRPPRPSAPPGCSLAPSVWPARPLALWAVVGAARRRARRRCCCCRCGESGRRA